MFFPASLDWGHTVFARSVGLQKALTLAIAFKWKVIELPYFTCVLLVLRLFFSSKVKVICQGQGQISRSYLKKKKKAITRA